jgi:hypothetical protein
MVLWKGMGGFSQGGRTIEDWPWRVIFATAVVIAYYAGGRQFEDDLIQGQVVLNRLLRFESRIGSGIEGRAVAICKVIVGRNSICGRQRLWTAAPGVLS